MKKLWLHINGIIRLRSADMIWHGGMNGYIIVMLVLIFSSATGYSNSDGIDYPNLI